MKPQSVIGLFLLFAAFISMHGQVKPKAELVDEIGAEKCSTIRFKTLNFLEALRDNPLLTGYAVIYPEKADLRRALFFEDDITHRLLYLKFPAKRVFVVRGEPRDTTTMQFWKVLNGAQKPDFHESTRSFKLPKQTKPLLYMGFGEEVDECFLENFETNFGKFLIANSTLDGRLEVHRPTIREFRTTSRDILRKLHNIPRRRLKFMYFKDDTWSVDAWLVPKRKI
jgi:hypothetical protein